MALTCGLLATLLQQWARRYLTVTQPPRYSPHKRARVRAFFAKGVEKFRLPLVVEVLPALLHASLFFFFSGLLIFLFNTNHTVFRAVLWWVGISAGVYGFITVLPVLRLDCPYHAPLSSLVWTPCHFLTVIFLCCFYGLNWRLRRWLRDCWDRLWDGAVKSTEEAASKMSKGIDRRILLWIYDALDEDGELLQFFEGIPGFCSSKVVDVPKELLAHLCSLGLTDAFDGFLKRTWASSLLSETVKERWLMVCMQAIDALGRPFPSYNFLKDVFTADGQEVLRSVRMGHLFRSRCLSSDDRTALSAQLLVAGIIATVPERDYQWEALVTDHLGIQEGDFQYYPGDSVLLANFIDIAHELFRSYDVVGWGHSLSVMWFIQPRISNFDIQNTLPVLQYDFCALRNEMISKADRSPDRNHFIPILYLMSNVYIRLHRGADDISADFGAEGIYSGRDWFSPCNLSQNHNLHGAAAIPDRMRRDRSRSLSRSRASSYHPVVHSAARRHRSRPSRSSHRA
jgi:hypothetical protein